VDKWLGNSPISEQYHCLYNIVKHKQQTILGVFNWAWLAPRRPDASPDQTPALVLLTAHAANAYSACYTHSHTPAAATRLPMLPYLGDGMGSLHGKAFDVQPKPNKAVWQLKRPTHPASTGVVGSMHTAAARPGCGLLWAPACAFY
jgi:hypothetical protein